MPGGGYGGDGSVKWWLDVDNVKSFSSSSDGRKHHLEGVDDTPKTGRAGTFTIRITLPRKPARRKEFLEQLRTAASEPTDPVELTIPIEDVKHGGPNYDQIKVYWPEPPRDDV
jgi:hypothetical protein